MADFKFPDNGFGQYEIEKVFSVSYSSGYYGQASAAFTEICGLRKWTYIDSLYNKTPISKEQAESGYFMNATAVPINEIYYENSLPDNPTLDKENIAYVGFTNLQAKDPIAILQNEVLNGEWTKKLLLF